MSKFETKLENFNKKIIKSEESANLNMNFGVASIEENPEIRNLYQRYIQTNENNNVNLNFDESQNLFLIINHTNEKFVFKNFKSCNNYF